MGATSKTEVRSGISPETKKHVTPKWVDVAVIAILALLMLQMIAIFLPVLWGVKWHNIGCDAKSWSMATPGGVMPLSQYWIKKAPAYLPGDIVSFQYNAGGTADENGGSVKVVDATAQGWVHVHGMNIANTVVPCWVQIGDVNGKIVAGPFSLMPTPFWRWLTMNWSLQYEDIRQRFDSLLKAPIRCLTSRGRFRNWVGFTYSPRNTAWSVDGRFAAVSEASNSPETTAFYFESVGATSRWGKIASWRGTTALMIITTGWQEEFYTFCPATGKELHGLTADWQVRSVPERYKIRVPRHGEVALSGSIVETEELKAALDESQSTAWRLGATDEQTKSGRIRFAHPVYIREMRMNVDMDISVSLLVEVDGISFKLTKGVRFIPLARYVRVITLTFQKNARPEDTGFISDISFW
ncbi:MAG: hypothetical protein NTZ65_01800 [Candidatus Berkelbacteria bacterium]|nr:hypothetical protein [Candidatus Berkelbacteria bacterium]